MTFDLQTCGHGNVAIQLNFYLCIHAGSFNIANLGPSPVPPLVDPLPLSGFYLGC